MSISRFRDSISLHTKLHDQISEFGHGLKWAMLDEYEWDQWIQQRNEATGLFGFLKRHSLRKAMRAKGLEKIADLRILESSVAARETLRQLKISAAELEGTAAWSGVDSDSEQLNRSLIDGSRALKLFKAFIASFADPTLPIGTLRRHLIEGRDFLSDSSQIVRLARRVAEEAASIAALNDEAEALKIAINADDDLSKIATDFGVVADQSERLSRWCRWLAAKKHATEYQLEPLSLMLETRASSVCGCVP